MGLFNSAKYAGGGALRYTGKGIGTIGEVGEAVFATIKQIGYSWEARGLAIQLLAQNMTILNAKGEPILTVSELTDQLQVVAASGQPLRLVKFENGSFTPVQQQQQPQTQQQQQQQAQEQQQDAAIGAATLAEMLASC